MSGDNTEFPTMETERLVLREIGEDDAEWYLSHFSKTEIVDATGFEAPADLAAARKEMEEFIIGLRSKGQGVRWGICLKGGTELIGSAGFYKWEKEHNRAEIGYDLDPGFWGEGIMSEALGAVISYGFEEMGLNRITLLAFEFNERSAALARKLGFKLEGVLRKNSFWKGEYRNDLYFALLREEWRREGNG